MMNRFLIFMTAISLLMGAYALYEVYVLKQMLAHRPASNAPVANGEVVIHDAASQSPFDKPNQDPAGNQYNNQSSELTPPAAPTTSIEFEHLSHDFGRINAGAPARATFVFRNTGNKPLIVSNAVGSCGCTVPEWPKEPVAPGGKGEILISFDSKGKYGEQTKTVSVSANTNPTVTTLTIRATVVPNN